MAWAAPRLEIENQRSSAEVALYHFVVSTSIGAALRWAPFQNAGRRLTVHPLSDCCRERVQSRNAFARISPPHEELDIRRVVTCTKCKEPVSFTVDAIKLARDDINSANWAWSKDSYARLELFMESFAEPLTAAIYTSAVADLLLNSTLLVESACKDLTRDPRASLDSRREKAILDAIQQELQGRTEHG